jgi:citrate lyase subunit beta/citryl-CoA lyase
VCAPPVDGVTTALSDVVPVVHEAFRPSAEEIAWARAVLEAGEGVTAVGGRMVDRPVVLRARRVLARAAK